MLQGRTALEYKYEADVYTTTMDIISTPINMFNGLVRSHFVPQSISTVKNTVIQYMLC
jgi:hypothetical protein